MRYTIQSTEWTLSGVTYVLATNNDDCHFPNIPVSLKYITAS